MEKEVTILTGAPTVIPIAQMELRPLGIEKMMDWVETHRPECLPDKEHALHVLSWQDLFPHNLHEGTRGLTGNELLVELAGRKCYDSFGKKAGKKSNSEYIEHTQSGSIVHASIMYHAKVSFFVAGISRRVSHELIRNYVGSDRDEEGSPSQESTRFTHHYGFFVAPPRYVEDAVLLRSFKDSMQLAYNQYLRMVSDEFAKHKLKHGGEPKGMDRKRIYEAASSLLPHQSETSFIWTTNPVALAKMVKERSDEAADLEIQRLARTWQRVAYEHWPNLFPQWRGILG